MIVKQGMRLSVRSLLFGYFMLELCSGLLAITPCDLRALTSKLHSREELSDAKEPMNRPLLRETVSTTVNLSLSINDLNILDFKTLEIRIDLGMTQRWYDDRLAPDCRTRKLAVLGAIWQPKITFVIGETCPELLGSDKTQFWRGTSNGSVLYSERFLVRPKCPVDLSKYPFDSQTCFLKIGSYRFPVEEVDLKWSSDVPVELRVNTELGEFQLQRIKTYSEIESRTAGNFSILVLEIRLKRYARREVLQSFIPSVIFTKTSYGVLWMKLSAMRTRIWVCQSSLVGVIFHLVNSNYGVSNVTCLKALDVWFLICIVFTLIPLVQSIAIYYLNSTQDFDSKIESEATENETGYETKKYGARIDKISRLLHPVALLFSATTFFAMFLHIIE